MVEAENECELSCKKKLWDGYGRWSLDSKWKPFIEEINLPSSLGKSFNNKFIIYFIGR